ncbi:MAG: cytochrome c oxidase assembly protein [Anaerolineae bacterium]
MNPLAVGWLAWEWRPEVIGVITLLAGLYAFGWWRLRRRGRRIASTGRLVAYMTGIAALIVALVSPIDALQPLLFSMHMVQHELLMMVAAPLIMLGNPLPILAWGLPAPLRRALGVLLGRDGAIRWAATRLLTPWVAWAIYVVTLWGWHTPAAYNAALRYDWIHDLEHMTFFWSAILFWWPITGAAPLFRGTVGYGARLALMAASLAQNEILGVSIALAREPIYEHYLSVPRLWGLSVMADQALGGGIMWIAGGMMYVVAIIALIGRFLEWDERRAERESSRKLRRMELSAHALGQTSGGGRS